MSEKRRKRAGRRAQKQAVAQAAKTRRAARRHKAKLAALTQFGTQVSEWINHQPTEEPSL